MPTSTVPAVWSALHALVDGLTLTITRNATHELPVSFGAPMNEDASFIAVGYSGEGDPVDGTTEWASIGRLAQEESYSIDCTIFVNSGDTDLSTRVTEAYGYLAAITTGLAADYTLGGRCRVAQVARHSLSPVQDADGSAVTLTFTVAVAARIT